jgi:hypothetical protein
MAGDLMLARLADAIAYRLTPYPEPGTALCIRCALNDRQNLPMPAEHGVPHLESHAALRPRDRVRIKVYTRHQVDPEGDRP